MSKNNILLLSMAVSIFMTATSGSAGEVMAQSRDPLHHLFSSADTVSSQNDFLENGQRNYQSVRVTFGKYTVSIDNLVFSVEDDADYGVKADTVVLREKGSAFAVALSQVSSSLSDWPHHAPDVGACALNQTIKALSVEKAQLVFGESSALGDMSLSGLSYTKDQETAGCWLGASLGFDKSELTFKDSKMVITEGARLNLSLPLSVKALNNRKEDVRAEIGVDNTSYLLSADKIVLAGSAVDIDFAAERETFIGIVRTFSQFMNNHSASTRRVQIMQLVNAIKILDGRLDLSVPRMRLHSARLLPQNIMASFADVNLLRLTGNGKMMTEFKNGEIGSLSELSLNGLFDLRLDVHATAEPFLKSELLHALNGGHGRTIASSFVINKVRLDYRDRGLDESFDLLFGSPPGRYINEFAQSLADSWGSEMRESHLAAAEATSLFFRNASFQKLITLTAGAKSPVDFDKLTKQFRLNPASLKDIYDFSLTVNEN